METRIHVTLFTKKKILLLHKMKEHMLYRIGISTLYVQEESLHSEKNRSHTVPLYTGFT